MKLLRNNAENVMTKMWKIEKLIFLGDFTTKIVAIFNIKFYFVFITMPKVK